MGNSKSAEFSISKRILLEKQKKFLKWPPLERIRDKRSRRDGRPASKRRTNKQWLKVFSDYANERYFWALELKRKPPRTRGFRCCRCFQQPSFQDAASRKVMSSYPARIVLKIWGDLHIQQKNDYLNLDSSDVNTMIDGSTYSGWNMSRFSWLKTI